MYLEKHRLKFEHSVNKFDRYAKTNEKNRESDHCTGCIDRFFHNHFCLDCLILRFRNT